MPNYSQLTPAQQTAIDTYVSSVSPSVGQLSRLLTSLSAVDTEYVSIASAALALLTASEYSFANFAATLATGSAPSITSASHNFTADEVGNFFNLTAGTNWTPGLYEIANVVGNAAILDRACATVASPTSGTANVLAAVPNKVGLAGIQPRLSRADIVTMAFHLETALALMTSANKQIWIKACGPSNL
jgi:hypothetical protein